MTKVIQQGAVDFSVSYKVQTTWGSQEALTFVLEGLGASLFFASFFYWSLGGMIAGVVVLMASGLLLLLHLGNPKNMIYVLANIRHSWMSRGAALIPLYIVLGVLTIYAEAAFGIEINGALRQTLLIVFFLLMVFVLLKSGLVLTTFPAISFWNGGLLPVIFGLSGLTSGLAVFATFVGPVVTIFLWGLTGAMGLLLLVLVIYLVTIKKTGKAAKVSVALIKEHHFGPFYIGGIVFGLVLPIGLGLYMMFDPSNISVLLIVQITLLRLIGDFMLREVILKVGVFDKVLSG